jgi:hypothetical protein
MTWERGLGPSWCARCGAFANEPCRSRRGHPRRAHRCRVPTERWRNRQTGEVQWRLPLSGEPAVTYFIERAPQNEQGPPKEPLSMTG